MQIAEPNNFRRRMDMKANRERVFGLAALAAIIFFVLGMAGNALAAERHYWIKAEEVQWDFMPSWPLNLMDGSDMTGDIFTDPNAFSGAKGRIYTKAAYRQYTEGFEQLIDGAFAPSREPGAPNEHMGITGPAIRAVVGDTIVVHFKNETSIDTSVHPHGVLYDKTGEGAPYIDNCNPGDPGCDPAGPGDVVPPGGEHIYVWGVPDRAGPGPNDASSIVWPYHAHTPETASTNAGLIGPIVIYRPNAVGFDASGAIVTRFREFFTLFTIFNENASALFDANFPNGVPKRVDPDEFEESNLMHGMNGLLWGNNTGYNMQAGEKVRWYIMAMGTEVDMHTAHWHGVTLLRNGHREDVTGIFPATTATLEMLTDNPGKWMFHCHVNDHLDAGMMTTFTIR